MFRGSTPQPLGSFRGEICLAGLDQRGSSPSELQAPIAVPQTWAETPPPPTHTSSKPADPLAKQRLPPSTLPDRSFAAPSRAKSLAQLQAPSPSLPLASGFCRNRRALPASSRAHLGRRPQLPTTAGRPWAGSLANAPWPPPPGTRRQLSLSLTPPE